MNESRQAVLVGIGETEYRKWGGFADRTEMSLVCEAVLLAAADAGLPYKDIDGFASYANDANESQLIHATLGMHRLRYAGGVWGGGGGGGCGAVGLAASAVESGQADFVVVVRAICQGTRGRFGQFRPGRAYSNFMAPFGMFSPAQMLGLMVQRYMSLNKVSRETLFQVARTIRENANRNPHALMYQKPLTEKDYFSARMIASPLCLFDCCLECDGAAAVIVTTRQKARDLRHPGVPLLAWAQGSEPRWGAGPIGPHTQPTDVYATANAGSMAKELYARAGITADDIDVAELYDHFSGMVLLALEDYMFCERGKAAEYVAGGNIAWPNGKMPINTSGGHLSEGYMHGLNHVLEGVRQARGASTSQVADMRYCLVCSSPGVAPTSALILGAENG